MTPTKTPPQKKAKRTYVLSSQTLERFETQVPAGQRGAFITQAIEKQLEEQRRAEIHAAFEEFGRDQASQTLYAQIDYESSRASDEVWSAIDDDWSKMSAEAMDEEFAHGA